MACPRCESETVSVAVPESLRAYAPVAAVSVCTNCLTIDPAEDGAADPELDAVSEQLPDGDAGVGTLLLVDLLDSLARNRSEIEELVGKLEAEGTDPLLVLDRLANDSGVEPAVDIERRRQQLEQLVL